MHQQPKAAMADFNPRPPRGERLTVGQMCLDQSMISIHALREESDAFIRLLHTSMLISIHALREESDRTRAGRMQGRTDFNPRPPRGERHGYHAHLGNVSKFQSTPSARRATASADAETYNRRISIHALREEGDCWSPACCQSGWYFNPRPPRGGRPRGPWSVDPRWHFNPRPPRGGRPDYVGYRLASFNISIHALREEGDRTMHRMPNQATHFNPRPPRGGRPRLSATKQCRFLFQSTPSARRATLREAVAVQHYYISIHALREEGDHLMGALETIYGDFNPRPPRGGRP